MDETEEEKVEEKLDPGVIDLRNVEFLPNPEPELPPQQPAEPAQEVKPRTISVGQMFLIMGIALAALAVFLYFMVWRVKPAAQGQIYRPTCPNGQPLPHGQVCPKVVPLKNKSIP